MVSPAGLANQFSVRGELGRVSTCHTSTHQIVSHVMQVRRCQKELRSVRREAA
jgi:hypothetical protein